MIITEGETAFVFVLHDKLKAIIQSLFRDMGLDEGKVEEILEFLNSDHIFDSDKGEDGTFVLEALSKTVGEAKRGADLSLLRPALNELLRKIEPILERRRKQKETPATVDLAPLVEEYLSYGIEKPKVMEYLSNLREISNSERHAVNYQAALEGFMMIPKFVSVGVDLDRAKRQFEKFLEATCDAVAEIRKGTIDA